MVCRKGQPNDMRDQVVDPSPRMEGGLARDPQEPRLVADDVERTSDAHHCHASRAAQPRRFPQSGHPASQGAVRCRTSKSATDALDPHFAALPTRRHPAVAPAQEGADRHGPAEDRGGDGDTRPCGWHGRPAEATRRHRHAVQLAHWRRPPGEYRRHGLVVRFGY